MKRAAERSIIIHETCARLPTRFGDFGMHVFRELRSNIQHMALVAGSPFDGCLARVHSECATGDLFGSLRCDCRSQLEEAQRLIGRQGGIIVYMRGHEGRGIGIAKKLEAYNHQDNGLDTIEANHALGLPSDARDYRAAGAILRYFNICGVRLLTNNPVKIDALERMGIAVEPVVFWPDVNMCNSGYIATKIERMGHLKPKGASCLPA